MLLRGDKGGVEQWVRCSSSGFRHDVQVHLLCYGGNMPGSDNQTNVHGCVVTFPVRCRPQWQSQGWCRTCSRSQTLRTCACGPRWGCRRRAAAAAAPGWPCRPMGSPGGRGWGRSWTGPPSPPSAPGSSGSGGGRRTLVEEELEKSLWQWSHLSLSFIPLTAGEEEQRFWFQKGDQQRIARVGRPKTTCCQYVVKSLSFSWSVQ